MPQCSKQAVHIIIIEILVQLYLGPRHNDIVYIIMYQYFKKKNNKEVHDMTVIKYYDIMIVLHSYHVAIV